MIRRSSAWLALVLLVTTLGATNARSQPLTAKALEIKPSEVVGGQTIEVIVTLSRAGVAGVKLSSNDPETIPIRTGYTVEFDNHSRQSVVVETSPVDGNRFVTLSANSGAQTVRTTVVVTPPPEEPTPEPLADVEVSAGELFRLAERAGFGAVTSIGGVHLTSFCDVDDRRDQILARFMTLRSGSLVLPGAPAPFDEDDYSCDVVLLGARLRNGWELVKLTAIGSSDCSQGYASLSLSRRSADLADTTHDLRLTAWAGTGDTCTVTIGKPVLRGPAGSDWKDAFGD